MKYSICAQSALGNDLSSGHLTASSALATVATLKAEGARDIQIFDFKTGRLMDEAALARADIPVRHPARVGGL